MAIKVNLETTFGETRELYVRVDSVDASNADAPATALVYGFLSREFCKSGKTAAWGREVQFTADVTQPLWPQAYEALKLLPECAGAVYC